MSEREAIGVDLGGTKMLVGVVGEGPAVRYRNLVGSRDRTQEELVDQLEQELRAALEARPAAAAIGLGVPCTIDRRRGVCVGSVHLPIAELPLGTIVADRLGLPVELDNDANLAALAEHRTGAARGARNAVLLTIGTGIGGGLIIDGRLYRGSSGAAAELGHVVIDDRGPACNGNCPNRGCLEAFVSGSALEREGRAAAERQPASELGRLLEASGRIDGHEILVAAQQGDEPALAVFAEMGRRLGVGLSGLANTFDPDVIVLGGGVMEAGELLLEPARAELRARALPPQNRVPVRPAALGVEAGMIGAATLALERLEDVPAVVA